MSPQTEDANLKSIKNSYLQKLVIIAIALIALIVLAFVIYTVSKRENMAFVINGKYYSKHQIESLIAYPVSVGDTKAIASHRAFLLYEDQAVANKLHIKVLQSSVDTYIKNLDTTLKHNPDSNNAQPWMQLVAYDDVLHNELASGLDVQQAEGYVFNFWFNQHENYGRALSSNISGNGNPQLIAQDRSYAQSHANYYDAQLESGKITAGQLISSLNADSRLNQDSIPNSTNSMQFGNSTTESWQEQIANQNVISYIDSQNTTGISGVEVGTLPAPTTINASGRVDSFFFIVELNRLPQNEITPAQFNGSFNSLKTTYRGV